MSNAYYTIVSRDLLSLLFFDKFAEKHNALLLENTNECLKELFDEYSFAKDNEIASNQIFMLMFSENIN